MLETLLDNLFILNGVFRPNNGSIALAKVAINYEGSFLDLGTGSGFITIAMYQSGKIGDSSDISSLTLSCAEKNFNLYNIPIKPIQSNLFEEITSTYDTIIFNPPTNNFLMERDENILKNKLKNIISPTICMYLSHIYQWVNTSRRREGILDFIFDVEDNVNSGGRVLMNILDQDFNYLIKHTPSFISITKLTSIQRNTVIEVNYF